jgi:hypothetical protein
VLATGHPASPGAAFGQIIFTHKEAVEKAEHGKKSPVILVLRIRTPKTFNLWKLPTAF